MISASQLILKFREAHAPLYARALGRWYHWSPDAREVIPFFRAALADPAVSHGDRLDAAQALALFGEPVDQWLPAILQALNSEELAHRKLALDALAYIGLPAAPAVPHILRLFESPDATLRLRAVQALHVLRPPLGEVAAQLLEQLAYEDYDVWMDEKKYDVVQATAGALAARGRAVVPWLIPQLKHPQGHTRRKVVDILDQIGRIPEEAADALIDSFLDGGTWRGDLIVSLFATDSKLYALCWLDSHQSAIERMLQRPETPLRVLALSFINHLRVADAVWLHSLLVSAADEDPEVRQAALMALAKQDPSTASIVPTLLKAADDAADEVRRLAVEFLSNCLIERGKRGDCDDAAMRTLVDLLCRRTRDERANVREQSARELGRLKASEAVVVLRRLLLDREFDVRRAAGRSLDQITGDVAEYAQVLVRALDDDATTFTQTCYELESLSRAAAGVTAALLSRWEGAEPEARRMLACTLAATAPDHAAIPLLLNDADADVRVAAWQGLANAGSVADESFAPIEAAFNGVAEMAGECPKREAYAAARALWELGNRSGRVTMLVVDQLLASCLYTCKDRVIIGGATFEELRLYWPGALQELEEIVLEDRSLIQLVIAYINDADSVIAINACRLVWKLEGRADLVVPRLSASPQYVPIPEVVAIAELVTEIGPKAKDAMSTAQKLVESYGVYRWYGIQMLGSMGPAARETLPDILKAIEKSAQDHRFWWSQVWKSAVHAMAVIRPDIQEAVPALLDAVENPGVCRTISERLRDLFPEGMLRKVKSPL